MAHAGLLPIPIFTADLRHCGSVIGSLHNKTDINCGTLHIIPEILCGDIFVSIVCNPHTNIVI